MNNTDKYQRDYANINPPPTYQKPPPPKSPPPPKGNIVPDGYALISIPVLKAWGKYDEVIAACRYPISPLPLSEE